MQNDEMIVNSHVILIDIDSILDTRLGTVDLMYGGEVSKSLLSAKYQTRPTDELHLINPAINTADFKAAYDKRTVDNMARGIPTNLMTEFGSMLDAHLEDILGPNPENKRVSIEINIAPYDLTPEECNDIIECVREWTGTPFDIKTVNIPVESFTMPMIASRKWSVIFTYDFDKFQYYTFVKNAKPGHQGNPQVSLFVPRLASTLEALKDSASLTLPDGSKLDTFDFMRVHYGPLIGLEFIPVEKFCNYLSV